jgi:hypothetical protein
MNLLGRSSSTYKQTIDLSQSLTTIMTSFSILPLMRFLDVFKGNLNKDIGLALEMMKIFFEN